MVKRSIIKSILRSQNEHGVYKINPDDNLDYVDEEDNNNKKEDYYNNEYKLLNDEYDRMKTKKSLVFYSRKKTSYKKIS